MISFFFAIYVLIKFLFFDNEIFVIFILLFLLVFLFFYLNTLPILWYVDQVLSLFLIIYNSFLVNLRINRLLELKFLFLFQKIISIFKSFWILLKSFYFKILYFYVWSNFYCTIDDNILLLKKVFYKNLIQKISKLV